MHTLTRTLSFTNDNLENKSVLFHRQIYGFYIFCSFRRKRWIKYKDKQINKYVFRQTDRLERQKVRENITFWIVKRDFSFSIFCYTTYKSSKMPMVPFIVPIKNACHLHLNNTSSVCCCWCWCFFSLFFLCSTYLYTYVHLVFAYISKRCNICLPSICLLSITTDFSHWALKK